MQDVGIHKHNNCDQEDWRAGIRERIKVARELPVNELTFRSQPSQHLGLRCLGLGASVILVTGLALYFATVSTIISMAIFFLATSIGACLLFIGARQMNAKTSLCVAGECVVYKDFVFNICTRTIRIPKNPQNHISVEHLAGATDKKSLRNAPRYRIWLRTPDGRRYQIAGGLSQVTNTRKMEMEARQLLNSP